MPLTSQTSLKPGLPHPYFRPLIDFNPDGLNEYQSTYPRQWGCSSHPPGAHNNSYFLNWLCHVNLRASFAGWCRRSQAFENLIRVCGMDTKGSFSKGKKDHFLQVQKIGYPHRPSSQILQKLQVVINRREEALVGWQHLPPKEWGPWKDVLFLHLYKRLELIAFQECDWRRQIQVQKD